MKQQKMFLLGLADYLENVSKLIQLQAEPTSEATSVCIELNPVSLMASYQDKSSEPLTAKEFQIATYLNSVADKVVTRDEILRNVWGSVRVNAKTVNVHIFNLRRKLAPLGIKIVFMEPDSYRLLCGHGDCAHEISRAI